MAALFITTVVELVTETIKVSAGRSELPVSRLPWSAAWLKLAVAEVRVVVELVTASVTVPVAVMFGSFRFIVETIGAVPAGTVVASPGST